jgi:hypothetical protein
MTGRTGTRDPEGRPSASPNNSVSRGFRPAARKTGFLARSRLSSRSPLEEVLLLNRTSHTTVPEKVPVNTISGHSVSATKRLGARDRARLAAMWRYGMVKVTPTIRQAAEIFGASIPYVNLAIADLKTAISNGNGHGNGGRNCAVASALDDVQLSLDDLWTHLDEEEQAIFVRRNLDSVWIAVEAVTS